MASVGGSKDGGFTPAELKDMRENLWPSFASFRASDWSIASEDMREFCSKVSWPWKPRTEDQVKLYEEYWVRNFNSRIPFDSLEGIMATIHDNAPYLRDFITKCDKNGDGFIDKHEYEFYLKIITLHVPGFNKTFEEFVKDVDTNNDGKVSIQEAIEWFEKHLE